jgi:virginiamycin B lyase
MLALSVALATFLLAPPAATATITEFPLPQADSAPFAITAGPDGALWFTERGNGLGAGRKIGRIATGGTITEFPIPAPSAPGADITTGPDGALWFTEVFTARIGRVTTGGAFSEFQVTGAGTRVLGIAAGPDGALWFTANGFVGRMTTAGAVTLFSLGGGDAQNAITAGPDGALWFTEQNANRIARITTSGTITTFPVPTPDSAPAGIVTGPDGALWFTEPGGNKIGRITTGGAITEFPVRTPAANPFAITAGSDGALWFTELGAGKIGRMTTAGAVTDFRIPRTATDVAAGSDGALWFTDPLGGRIGRITTDQPPEDAVDGTLFTEAPCNPPEVGCTKPRYMFGVSSGPSGERPTGQVFFVTGERNGIMVASGAPTCLRVEGRRASIGVELAPGDNPPGPPPRAAIIVVEDNGPAGTDRLAVQDLPAGSAPSVCPSPTAFQLGPGFPPADEPDDPGVVVVDVQPPARTPTSKEQCKDGGWRAFGFRNQGQCIAFVARGPKPPGP